ncbi:MAG: prepilin-type N-terminal cleavage/methylation domain-containing protein [Patescibacteria group bacterium]|nr:prepilin-type N-terminal cleavage/methylation domain-containing protein [Patescibacteria group bacterium]
MNKKGFTLIELLVVIAIIGLLSTLSVLALNGARARARDAKRIADIKQIQTALEMYYNDNNVYPSLLSQLTTTTPPLIKVLPTAPTPTDGNCTGAQNTYTYTFYAGSGGSGTATYALTYCLGSATGNVASGAKTASPSGIQ